MYVCLYLYVYLFYCVYCVPCTANRKPVCHFTCGLLTFTEARRDRTTAHRLRPRPAGPTPNPLGPRNAGAASLGTWLSLHSTPVGAPPGAVSCPCRAHSAYADPAAEKAKVYALPLYAESAPCNRKPHPVCVCGGQSANTLQTTGAGVTPSNNTRKPCRSWENARPQRLQKMPFGAPNAPIDQLCGRV